MNNEETQISERAERAKLAERTEETQISERAERAKLAERTEKAENSERAERAKLAERTEKAEISERAERAERGERMEDADRKERVKRAEKEMREEKFKPIILRSYSKVIFFFPLCLFSAFAWFIGLFLGTGEGQGWIAIIWIAIFFLNLLVGAFNFPTPKFVLLILCIVISIVAIWLIVTYTAFNMGIDAMLASLLTINLSTAFYGSMFLGIGITLSSAFMSAHVKSVRIEQNEVILKSALLGETKRFPTGSLRYTIEISDVFEYILLGAGKITFEFASDIKLVLETVPLINRKTRRIDKLLSMIKIVKN